MITRSTYVKKVPLEGKPYADAQGNFIGIFAGLRHNTHEVVVETEDVLNDEGVVIATNVLSRTDTVISTTVESPAPVDAVELAEIPPPPLTQIKAAAASAIDSAAGAARARYITIAPGQEATYQIKAEQAAAYKSAGYPADASPWALIDLEAQATGSTPRNTADLVLATRDAWVQIAAQIEAARIGGKQAVAQAADGAAVDAARDVTLATLEAI